MCMRITHTETERSRMRDIETKTRRDREYVLRIMTAVVPRDGGDAQQDVDQVGQRAAVPVENGLAGDVAQIHLQLQGQSVQDHLAVGDVVMRVLMGVGVGVLVFG